jgi:hypothetical protein
LINPAAVPTYRALLLVAALAAPGWAQDDEVVTGEVHLSATAAELNLRHGRRKTTAGSIDERLSPSVRVALNNWADVVAAHELSVVLPKNAEVVVFGLADSKVLSNAAGVLDETWEMLDDLRPAEDEQAEAATLVFLFDEGSMGGEAWQAVLDALVERNELIAQAASALGADPGPLMLRGLPGFLQPTYDMAGDAASGDDEFRLENELAHKLTQCVLKARFGEVPESIRWGMGFLVEQRQFRSIYQMNATGFVAAVDHFDWPKKARGAILASYKDEGWTLSEQAARTDTAGRAVTSQMITWGALDYLYKKDSEALNGMLSELSDLHAEAAGWRTGQGHYVGESDATAKVFAERLDSIDARKLASHLKKVK